MSRSIIWLLAIACLVFLVGYVLPHANYHHFDIPWEWAGIQSVMKGWQYQDLNLIIRPAYLLNVPFVYLGFGLYGLKLVCFCLELLAFLSFFWVWDRALFKTGLLPLGLIAFTAIYGMRYQLILNYYSAVLIFLLFGLAAYIKAQKTSKAWSVIAGICFVVAAFSNFAMIPAFLIVLFILLLLDRSKVALFQLLVFVVLGAVLVWSYLSFTGAGHLYHTQVQPGGLINTLEVSGTLTAFMFAVFVLFTLVGFAVHNVCFGKLRSELLLSWSLICFVLFCFIPMWLESVYGSFFLFYLGAPFALASLISLLLWLKEKPNGDDFRLSVVLMFFVAFIMASNKAISLSQQVIYLYLPVLFLMALALLLPHWKLKFRKLFYCLFLLAFMAFPVSKMLTTSYWPGYWIGVNSVKSVRGVFVDPYAKRVEDNLQKAYQQNTCGSKVFFAFYDFPQAYALVKRQPLFHESEIPTQVYSTMSRFDTNQELVGRFSHLSHWCVVYKTPSWLSHGLGRLSVFSRWLMTNSSRHIPLGRLPYKHSYVWLLVK